jgi:DNA-binding NtrC family response regulator
MREPLPEIAFDLPLKAAREQWNRVMELEYLQRLIARHEGNVSAAAKTAGVNRVHLYRLLWKHGLRGSERE